MTRLHRSASGAATVGRRWCALVAVLALAGALGGCTGTGGTARSSDPASPQPGGSGVTVFGDIDVGVTRERSR